ncbi:xylulokinase, partial [Pseudomonas fluorescens]
QGQSIRLIGGGSKSPVWRQMVADIMNTEVVCTEQSEAAALGAAIQAAWSQSGEPLASLCDKCVSVDLASRTLPSADHVSAYQHAYERYQQLVASL